MERQTKEQVVAELKETLSNASSCVVMDFAGVPMTTFTPFRKECAANNVKMIVVKNSLARIAVKDSDYKDLNSFFNGMTCLVFTMESDQVVGAKIVKKFAKEDKNIQVKGGMIDGKVLSVDQVKALADLPSKEELQAKLLATMLAVPQNFVRLLAAVPQNFVQLLNAYKEKRENEG